jgi:hypothetical protein
MSIELVLPCICFRPNKGVDRYIQLPQTAIE